MRRAVFLVALAASGCASFLRPDPAQTAAPGTSYFLVAPSGYVGNRKDGNLANMDVLYRRGISSRVDAGLRCNLIGAFADVKVALHRAPEPTRGVNVSVAPTVGTGVDITWTGSANGGAGDGTGMQVALPVLVDVNLGDFQLMVAPEAMYQHALLPAGILNLGGTVAFRGRGRHSIGFYPAVAVWKAVDPRHVIGSLGAPGALAIQPALVIGMGP